jgi:hypothetical protein
MKKQFIGLGLIAVMVMILAGVQYHSFLGKIYRHLFPRPLVGEIQAKKVRGINGAAFAETTPDDFSFIAVGHLYGATEGDDRLPDQALLSAIPMIKDLQPAFFVSLGDMVMHNEPEDFTLLDQNLLQQLPFPVFNTVGNHDVLNRDFYEAAYGQTYFTFKYGSARLVFLDTEIKDCDLSAPQVDMLKGAVQDALKDAKTRHIFIFMHKTLFFKNEVLASQKDRLGSPNGWRCYGQGGFGDLLEDVLLPAAGQKPVVLFAGDVGAWGNLTPYYEIHPQAPLTMIMTGLGDTIQDNLIYVRVHETEVEIETIFLQDLVARPLTEFTPSYWEQVAAGAIPLSP